MKTPKYWNNQRIFGKMTEVKTSKGNDVKIPEKLLHGWKTAEMTKLEAERLGLDPTASLEKLKLTQPLSYDLERVFYEIYQDKN